MKRWIFTALAVSALAVPVVAFAGADPTGGSLLTFGTGKVKVQGWSATIKNSSGQYGGVYRKNGPKKHGLDQVTFTFKSDGDVQGGAPRWSIPIDVDGDQKQDGYAFIDAAGCGATVGTSGHSTTVSTAKKNCTVYFGAGVWDNWAEFAADNPDYRVAKNDVPFIIADVQGNYHVYGFQFG